MLKKIVVFVTVLSSTFGVAQQHKASYFGRRHFIGVSYNPGINIRTNTSDYLDNGQRIEREGLLSLDLDEFSFRYYNVISNRIKLGVGYQQSKTNYRIPNNDVNDFVYESYGSYSNVLVGRLDVDRRRLSVALEYVNKDWAALPFGNFSNILELGLENMSIQSQEVPVARVNNLSNPIFYKYNSELNVKSIFLRVGLLNAIPINKRGIFRWGFEITGSIAFGVSDPEYSSLRWDLNEKNIGELIRFRLEYVLPLF